MRNQRSFRIEDAKYRQLKAALAASGQNLTSWINKMAEKLIAKSK